MNDKQLIFVGGLHRSGTSLLAKALAAHPDIAASPTPASSRTRGSSCSRSIPAMPSAAAQAGSASMRARILTEASPLATPANAERLWREWRAHWPSEGRWCLEKVAGQSDPGAFPAGPISRKPRSSSSCVILWRWRLPSASGVESASTLCSITGSIATVCFMAISLAFGATASSATRSSAPARSKRFGPCMTSCSLSRVLCRSR